MIDTFLGWIQNPTQKASLYRPQYLQRGGTITEDILETPIIYVAF